MVNVLSCLIQELIEIRENNLDTMNHFDMLKYDIGREIFERRTL